MFRPKAEKLAIGWRRMHNEKFHNMYSSPDFIRVIKSRKMRWEGHAGCMGELINV